MKPLFPMDDLPEPAVTGPFAPLADRLRPRSLDEVVGQEHLLGEGRFLRRLAERGQVCSMILWGPPGVGKTAMQAVHFLGMPEGRLALAQLAVYLAQAPKSNAVYLTCARVEQDVQRDRNSPVPLHLRNAPTALMRELGYGKGYRYAHEECLPDPLRERRYFQPTGERFEEVLPGRFEELRRLRTAKSK